MTDQAPSNSETAPGTTASGDTSAPAAKPAKAKTKPQKTLPTERIAFAKQLEILRAYGQLGSAGTTVANADVANVVGLHPSTTSLANAFFFEVGLLLKGADGVAPSPEVIAFARAHEWKQDTAANKLAPLLSNAWFGTALIPKVKFKPHKTVEAIAILADASAATPEHKSQLESLLELLQAGGLIQLDGDTVKSVRGGDDSAAPGKENKKPESGGDGTATQTLSVPADFIIYKCKIAPGRVIEIPLPPKYLQADHERLVAFLETQIDDPKPAATADEAKS